ncbi:uncharacterized protein LOC126908547 isoform X2 [Daktulosphaira vitifoliae]|uniref:uncharacterized protein LOC126908547 isoform X2 n=1 Tax=Daktulosphaira vitifoliae TaxID=58002 RepID=UPI0021A994A4|nr:uncharacterized protein LOC126908547 isoform X2 [Daktulosphaira vitifoliae]
MINLLKMWDLNDQGAYQTNEIYLTEDYYTSPQWDMDSYSNYGENERDLASVLMNLKDDCVSHGSNSHEEEIYYYNHQVTNNCNNNNQHQYFASWHTPITTSTHNHESSQRVPVYNPNLHNGYYQSIDNYNNCVLPSILDIDEELCKANVLLKEKKRVGRPRGIKSKRSKTEPKLSRIWEFIRDLLLDAQYCPTYICWENYEEGRFRFVQSDKVAKLWGKFKRNERMNYEKFSRAMRYYYKTGVLLPVQGKRLVYKFGPKATGWHTNNPNFKYAF